MPRDRSDPGEIIRASAWWPVGGAGAPLAYGADFHAAFFNDWLRFAGCSDVTEICWQPTALTAARDTDKTAALQRADAGSRF